MSKDKTKEDIREYTMKLDMKELVNIGFEAYRCALLSQYVHLYSSTRLQIRFQLLLPTSCGISETGCEAVSEAVRDLVLCSFSDKSNSPPEVKSDIWWSVSK